MSWKVEMKPEELEFIEAVLKRTLDNHDGRGPFIAPIRGGIIYLSEYNDYTEDQLKWLLFVRFQRPQYHMGRGIRFMNWEWRKPVPRVWTDPEAMEKWGVRRMTTDGQPVDDFTGLPLDELELLEEHITRYVWDPEQKRFVCHQTPSVVRREVQYRLTGNPQPMKLLGLTDEVMEA